MNAEFPLAVHALVYLLHTQRVTSSQELAKNICTNPARVRKVLAKLHHAGLVTAHPGKGSGYLTLPGAEHICLTDVLAALEETPISMNWRSGDMDEVCLVSSGMGIVMDGLYTQMNTACLQWLETVTIGTISDQIFKQRGATR